MWRIFPGEFLSDCATTQQQLLQQPRRAHSDRRPSVRSPLPPPLFFVALPRSLSLSPLPPMSFPISEREKKRNSPSLPWEEIGGRGEGGAVRNGGRGEKPRERRRRRRSATRRDILYPFETAIHYTAPPPSALLSETSRRLPKKGEGGGEGTFFSSILFLLKERRKSNFRFASGGAVTFISIR